MDCVYTLDERLLSVKQVGAVKKVTASKENSYFDISTKRQGIAGTKIGQDS